VSEEPVELPELLMPELLVPELMSELLPMEEEELGFEVVPPISFFFMFFMQVEKPLSCL
jgi:hypothetical protein